MPLAEELSAYALSLHYSELGTAAVHTVKQRLVDSLGCGLGAFDTLPSRNGRGFAAAHPSPSATVLGTTQTTPDVAAFVNGTMIRYFDFNDGYIGKEVGHPSDDIAACLAVAEAQKASGEDLLLAIVLAYEIKCRFQDAAALRVGKRALMPGSPMQRGRRQARRSMAPTSIHGGGLSTVPRTRYRA
jgi:2-methylcitrate dehydratase